MEDNFEDAFVIRFRQRARTIMHSSRVISAGNRNFSLASFIAIAVSFLAALAISAFSSAPSSAFASDKATGGCYISAVSVKSMSDGTAPFDSDDARGNDSNASNLRVRSFDQISYNLEYATSLTNEWQNVDEADARVEFILPCSPEVASFNFETFNWCLDQKLEYIYEDGSASTVWDKTKTVQKQRLTGYRHLSNSDGMNAIPGAGSLTVGVSVKAATEGMDIRPSFKMWIDGDEAHEAVSVEPPSVNVTSFPRYNIQLKRNNNMNVVSIYYDDVSGTWKRKKESGYKHGIYNAYGVTMQLYNTSVDKGLKGIELPSGDITFDIRISSDYSDDPAYTPFLWEYT